MKETQHTIKDFTLLAGLSVALCTLIAYPADAIDAARNGLSLCAVTIVPSLFPFLVVSQLFLITGAGDTLARLLTPAAKKLFGLGGHACTALVLGLMGGYPVGAKITAELRKSGRITREEAARLLSFTNNCGPAFIIGVAGAGVFGSVKAGLILLGIHALSALLTGLLLGRTRRTREVSGLPAVKPEPFTPALVHSVSGAVSATLGICGFVVLFSVLLRLLDITGLLGAASKLTAPLLGGGMERSRLFWSGILEVTHGITGLAAESNRLTAVVMAAWFLGWGGFSVHCQTLSVLSETDIPTGRYFLGKLVQATISAAAALFLFRLNPSFITCVANETNILTNSSANPLILGISAAVFLTLCLLIPFFRKKPKKRKRRSSVRKKPSPVRRGN